MGAYGGFVVADGVTDFYVPAAGVKLTSTNVPTLAASTVGKKGDASVSEAISTGRITLKPGVYKVDVRLALEGDYLSGTTGDSIGDITGHVYLAGSSVAGLKGVVNTQAADQKACLVFGGLIEVTRAQQVAGTNYIEFYLFSGDAKGNDVTIGQGQFIVTRLDG